MAETRPFLSDRSWSVLVWTAAAIIFLWNLYSLRWFIDDDTYISLRYVTHLVDHGELTWNLGERVEGYTNFLQIIATAALVKVGVDPVSSVRWINLFAVVGLFVATVSATKRLVSDNALGMSTGGFLVASCAPVVLWIWGGLEADLTAALVAAAIATLLPVMMTTSRATVRSLVTGLFFGLAYLSRPDALIAVGVAALSVCFLAPGTLSRRLWIATIVGVVTAAIIAAHLAWRLSYYGDPLPNTFYAKMALPVWRRFLIGTPYILKSMLSLPVVPLGLAGAAWAIATKKFNPSIGLLAATVVGYIFAVLWEGGDHMYGARMLVPVVGPASLLVVAILQVPSELEWRRGLTTIVVFIEACASLAFPRYRMDLAAFGGTLVGKYIEQAWPAGSLVGLNTAGSTPFFAPKFNYIDMLGLNDRVIAHRASVPMRTEKQSLPGHAKGDGAYVLRRAPAYIIAGPAEGALVENPVFLTDVELSAMPEFRRCYAAEIVSIPYTKATAAQDWLGHPRPLIFTYYRRTC